MPSTAARPTPPVAHWITRMPGTVADRTRSCRRVVEGHSEVITPTVSGEKRGKTAAVEAPKRVETTSASTLR